MRALLVAFVVFVCGCLPAQSAENPLRTAVVLASQAVHVADFACLAVVQEKHDVNLAETCDTSYQTARASLQATQSALDAGNSALAACAFKNSVDALRHMVAAVQAAGGQMPSIVGDALEFSAPLAATCKE